MAVKEFRTKSTEYFSRSSEKIAKMRCTDVTMQRIFVV